MRTFTYSLKKRDNSMPTKPVIFGKNHSVCNPTACGDLYVSQSDRTVVTQHCSGALVQSHNVVFVTVYLLNHLRCSVFSTTLRSGVKPHGVLLGGEGC